MLLVLHNVVVFIFLPFSDNHAFSVLRNKEVTNNDQLQAYSCQQLCCINNHMHFLYLFDSSGNYIISNVK